MTVKEKIQTMFPSREGVPAEFLPEFPVTQNEYLINGEMRSWKGEMQEVLSPVCLRPAGASARSSSAAIPCMTEKESLEALDAAAAAYDNGNGEWPSMPVEERIGCLEKLHAHDEGETGGDHKPLDVGDRQVVRRQRQGVRPHQSNTWLKR